MINENALQVNSAFPSERTRPPLESSLNRNNHDQPVEGGIPGIPPLLRWQQYQINMLMSAERFEGIAQWQGSPVCNL